MTTTPSLTNHSFLRWILDALRPRVPDVTRSTRPQGEGLEEWQARNRASMSAGDQYLYLVLTRTTNLLSAFDRLEGARHLIHRWPQRGRGKAKLLIDRAAWTEYHFLMFTATLGTVVDCCVLLVSDSYRLGLPEHHCKMDVVASNHWMKGTKAERALRSLSKSLSEHVSRRNRYLHRGEVADFGELTDPDFLKDLRMITFVSSVAEMSVDAKDLARMWRHALRDLEPLLEEINETASVRAGEVLTAVERPVRERHALLVNGRQPAPRKDDSKHV